MSDILHIALRVIVIWSCYGIYSMKPFGALGYRRPNDMSDTGSVQSSGSVVSRFVFTPMLVIIAGYAALTILAQ